MDIEEEFKELAFNVIEIEKQSEAHYTYYEEAINLINSIKSKFNSQREQTHKNFQYVDHKNHEINKLCHENEKLQSDLIEMATGLYDSVFVEDAELFKLVLKAQQIIKESK